MEFAMPGPPTATGDEIDLADLPPLDGDERDDPAEPGEHSLPEDIDPDTGGDLDDSTGENDAPHPEDMHVDSGEGGWLDEPPDAPGLAIGNIEIDDVDDVPTAAGGDEGAEADDADAVDLGTMDAGGLDMGEEGPDGPDEELRDQDLPLLGSAEDDEAPGDPGATDLLLENALENQGLDEPFGLGWAPKPWARVGAPVPIASAVDVACAVRGAIVAGYRAAGPQAPLELFRIDLEGGCQSLVASDWTGPARRLALAGGCVA